MKQRLITGFIGGAGFLSVLFYGDIPYIFLLAILAIIGFRELLRMNNLYILSSQGLIGVSLVFFLVVNHTPYNSYFNNIQEISIIFLATALLLTLTVVKKNKVTFNQVSYILLGALYVGFGFSFMLETRFIENGLTLTLLVIIATWTSDSGAYFTGKKFGKRKLWPEISPKKTIEGAIGGVIFAIIASLIYNYFVGITDYILLIIWEGLIISVIGQIGDLVESALKRGRGIKDSGTILPGHGGVLDRFDSLIFVFPVLHILHIL